MSNYSRGEVVLVRYPFSDLSGSKVRPAVVISTAHSSQDVLILPLTSRTTSLREGEFILVDWKQAGLNVETATKRGIYTVDQNLVTQSLGNLSDQDLEGLSNSLRQWLDL